MQRTYKPGEIIAKEGERDDSVYFLKSGILGILKGGRLIAEIGRSGEIFGEMSAILDKPRTATVKALTLCVVDVYSDGIDALIRDHPYIAKTLLKCLAERLTETTQRLNAYMFEQDKHKAPAIESYITSFKGIADVDDRIVQRVIISADNDDLIAALLGAIPRVRSKFFANMSSRKADIVKDDMHIATGIYTRKAIELAQAKILEMVNELITVRNVKSRTQKV